MTVREGQGDRRERQGSFGVGADFYPGGDTLKGVPMEQWVRMGEGVDCGPVRSSSLPGQSQTEGIMGNLQIAF